MNPTIMKISELLKCAVFVYAVYTIPFVAPPVFSWTIRKNREMIDYVWKTCSEQEKE